MNPIYSAYCKAHGKTPEEMRAHDVEAWPGGRMAGFMLWVSDARRRFYAAHPEAWIDRWSIGDHLAWEKWVAEQ